MVNGSFIRTYRLPRALLIGLLWTTLLPIGAGRVMAADFTYIVQPGDNLWNLTGRYLKSVDYWPRLQAYNRVLYPHAMRPGSSLLIPLKWLRREAVVARVVGVHGHAEVQRGEQVSPLKAGVAIAVGEILRTSVDGSLTLEFPDGSRSLLGPNSEMRMGELWRLRGLTAQQVLIELPRGHLENEVESRRPPANGRFIIDTPAGIAAVRGTHFRVDAADQQVRSETLRGEVVLQNEKGQVRLGHGTGSLARVGQAPIPPVQLLPAPQLDHLPERAGRPPLDLPFPDIPGASAYRTQLAATADFSTIDSDQVSTTARVRSVGDLADARYRLRVRAIDVNGFEGLDAEREIEINAFPEPPFPSQPVQDGFVAEETPEFRWTRSGEDGHYRFQLASDHAFRSLLADADKLTEPSFIYKASLSPGEYFWRVALTTPQEGVGPFSDPQRFRRPSPGLWPKPFEWRNDQLELRWRATGADDRYQVQLANDILFQQLVLDQESPQPVVAFAKPAAGTYYIRVRSFLSDGSPGPWGKPQIFEVPANYWPLLWMLLPVLLIVP